MKLKMMIFAVVLAVFFYCAAAFAADGGKGTIGVINIQKILIESKSGKEAKAVFDKELEAKRAVLASKEKGAIAIENELKANGAKMKADIRKIKEDKLASEIKDLKRSEQDMKDELQKRDNELTSKVLKEVLEITKKIGDEKGYTLILQASQQIVYIDSAIDITDEVLKRYDSGK